MKARRISAAAGGLAAAIAVGLGVGLTMGAGAAPAATAAQSWTDPAGDAQGGAPDITAVTVSDDAAGTITIVVTVPTAPEGSLLVVSMDTNLNGTSNDPVDAYVAAMGLGDGTAVRVTFRDAPFVEPDVTVDATPTTVTFRFGKASANIDRGFAFWLATETPEQVETDQWGDEMPDGTGMLTYVLSSVPAPPTTTPAPPVVKPLIGAPATSGRAIAGKRLTVTFPVTRSDNGQPLTTGTMVCDPSVAGRVIKHAESFRAGKARLSFVVPKTAKGKLLKVRVTIRAGTQSTTKVATFRVR